MSLFSIVDYLKMVMGGGKKKKSIFADEKEAYEFCEKIYKETGGVTSELRRAYEFYKQNYNDDCPPTARSPHN